MFARASFLLAVLALWRQASAAQIDPSDPLGRGAQRGIAEVNTSGQVGTVTLLRRGDRTLVAIVMHGVPAGKVESARIVRLGACPDSAPAPSAYALADLRAGQSETVVAAPVAKLLSGNYRVVIASGAAPDHLFACGELFH
jgi:hypothetical protein